VPVRACVAFWLASLRFGSARVRVEVEEWRGGLERPPPPLTVCPCRESTPPPPPPLPPVPPMPPPPPPSQPPLADAREALTDAATAAADAPRRARSARRRRTEGAEDATPSPNNGEEAGLRLDGARVDAVARLPPDIRGCRPITRGESSKAPPRTPGAAIIPGRAGTPLLAQHSLAFEPTRRQDND